MHITLSHPVTPEQLTQLQTLFPGSTIFQPQPSSPPLLPFSPSSAAAPGQHLTDLLVSSGLTEQQALQHTRDTLRQMRLVLPGNHYGGQWDSDLAGLWQQAAQSGARRLGLSITAEGSSPDESSGHLTISVTDRSDWDSTRAYRVSGIHWDSKDPDDLLPGTALVHVPGTTPVHSPRHAVMQALEQLFGVTPLTFSGLKEVTLLATSPLDEHLPDVVWMPVSEYVRYSQHPARQPLGTLISWNSPAEALSASGWQRSGQTWAYGERHMTEQEALALADIVAVRRYHVQPQAVQVWAFSQGSAQTAAAQLAPDWQIQPLPSQPVKSYT